MHKLVILTGPSGIGKTPLSKAIEQLYPAIAETLQPIVLYNSRDPRPGEREGRDYYFRDREEIARLGNRQDFSVFDVRGDTQGLDLNELRETIQEKTVFFEGNPYVGEALVKEPSIRTIPTLSVFVSPLSAEEIRFFAAPERHVSLPGLLTDIMRRKLLRRTRRQKGELSLPDLENIERRAQSAFEEIRMARHFDYVIPNHDGEDSENWQAFKYPVGDARKSVESFAALLQGKPAHCAEKWDEHIFEAIRF